MNCSTVNASRLKNKAARVIVTTGVCLAFGDAQAHPVVFAGGTALMGHQMHDMSKFEVVHSPTARTGLGVSLMRHKHAHELIVKGAGLLWRGNFPDFQANIYAVAGAGRQFARSHAGDSTSPLMKRIHSNPNLYEWAVSADGEDRQIYTMGEYSETYDKKGLIRQASKLRLGFAPYKANSDEMSIWGILEWLPEKSAGDSNWRHEVTPMLRMYYKNTLMEAGSSLNGKFTFNYMFHFFN